MAVVNLYQKLMKLEKKKKKTMKFLYTGNVSPKAPYGGSCKFLRVVRVDD